MQDINFLSSLAICWSILWLCHKFCCLLIFVFFSSSNFQAPRPSSRKRETLPKCGHLRIEVMTSCVFRVAHLLIALKYINVYLLWTFRLDSSFCSTLSKWNVCSIILECRRIPRLLSISFRLKFKLWDLKQFYVCC